MSHQVFKLKVLSHNNDETVIDNDDIYEDDTIERVKYKLVQSLDSTNYNEYCFFVQRHQILYDVP